jgi:hypothetical protein
LPIQRLCNGSIDPNIDKLFQKAIISPSVNAEQPNRFIKGPILSQMAETILGSRTLRDGTDGEKKDGAILEVL